MSEHLYVVLDEDDNGELVVKPTGYSWVIEAACQLGIYAMWDMPYSVGENSGMVTIYATMFRQKPTGENLEEVERLVLRKVLEG